MKLLPSGFPLAPHTSYRLQYCFKGHCGLGSMPFSHEKTPEGTFQLNSLTDDRLPIGAYANCTG